jgi:nucleoside-diphosphate-sugar epimerase
MHSASIFPHIVVFLNLLMAAETKRRNLVLGKGLIGSALTSFLKERGEEVKVLSRGDGHDLRHAEQYMSDFEWADRVWFVAWTVGVWKKDNTSAYEAEILDANLQLCQSVFGVLQKTGKSFLFVSSQAALAPDMMTLGVTKRVGEMWTKILSGHIARLWNVYGWEPVGEKSHLVPDFVWKGLSGGGINLMSNGEEKRQFLYVRDCVEALVHQFDGGQKEADITTGEWIPVKNVAELVGAKFGVPVTLGEKPGKPPLAMPEKPLASWKPRYSLNEGIDEIIKEAKLAWNQKNR